MAAPLNYRNAVPDLSSSSPLHNMTSLSSSPPLSPHSPTPLSRGISAPRPSLLHSPVTSNPDPFSGNAKASLDSHPSFGKDQLRSKHLRGSPEKAAQAGLKTWVLPTTRQYNRQAIDEALEQHFFDSSDDNPSSDWSGAMDHTSLSTAPSSMQNVIPRIGLGIDAEDDNYAVGLGQPFQEPGSPSLGRKSRVRTFSRTQSSSQDPFSAGAGSSYNASDASPKSHRQTQRRRLTGSSPKKLSRSSRSSQFNNISSDDSSDEGLVPWEEMVAERSTFGDVSWSSIVEQVFEKVDGSIELSKQGLTCVDPVVADLSKFVSIPPLRKEENLPASSGTFSRAPSFASGAFERSTSSASAFNSPKTRNRAHTGEPSSSSKLQMFLAGNRLQILPSAFFELHNLVVLILRDNGLEELPSGIGQLVNLRELNVSQNGLRYLPSEVQKLRLDSFLHFPNPFEAPPADGHLTIRRTFGQLSREEEQTSATPVVTSMGPPALPARTMSHARLASRPSFAMSGRQQSIGAGGGASSEMADVQIARCLPLTHQISPRLPSLMEICMRVLLEPEGEEEEEKRILLELFESGCLASLNKSLDISLIKSLEAARRSAVKAWGRVRPASTREGTWCSGAEASNAFAVLPRRSKRAEVQKDISAKEDEYGEASNEESAEEEERRALLQDQNVEEQLDRGDDSRSNPWFNRCPNPRHYPLNNKQPILNNTPFDWPGPVSGGKIFSKPSIQRIEWVSHVAGVAVTQIRLEEVAAALDSKKPMSSHKATLIPLQWKGCGPSCLDFLESNVV